jgi:hypothetical protein
MKSIALNVLDIVQNSIEAGASEISIELREEPAEDKLLLEISDNGRGMSEELKSRVTDPFVTTRTTRNVGLGLPLLRFHSELTGGKVTVDSVKGRGTIVKAEFGLSHPDRQPIGDIAGVVVMMIAANPRINFDYCHITDEGCFSVSTQEIFSTFGTDNIHDSSLQCDLKDFINQQLETIGA